MRLLWVEILKLLAIFGVIILHVSASFLVPFENSREWWIGNIYDSLSRWCVPLFVMVSGSLLLPGAGKKSLRWFLLKRVRKILIPFLIWSAVYFLYRIYIKGDNLVLFQFFPMLLTEPIYYHLWFIYMLIVLYLFAPAAGSFLNRAPPKHVWYLIALWFFWVSLLPIIDKPLDFQTYFTPDMDDYSPLKLSGYFLLGFLLRDWQIRPGWPILMVLLVFVTAGAVTIIGTYMMSDNRGEFHPFFYKYFSMTVVAMAVSLFLLVKTVFHTRKEITAEGQEIIRMNSPIILQKIGMSVFGVYLIHALILELLREGLLGLTIDQTSAFGITMSPAVGIPFFAMSIFLISLAVVFVMRFVPFLRDMIT
ncbi:MAG: acyltransferase family protein [Desulforhopalus sp.]